MRARARGTATLRRRKPGTRLDAADATGGIWRARATPARNGCRAISRRPRRSRRTSLEDFRRSLVKSPKPPRVKYFLRASFQLPEVLEAVLWVAVPELLYEVVVQWYSSSVVGSSKISKRLRLRRRRCNNNAITIFMRASYVQAIRQSNSAFTVTIKQCTRSRRCRRVRTERKARPALRRNKKSAGSR